LAIVWGLSMAGCRDFRDCRTPYKSFVAVKCFPINKDGAAIKDAAMQELLQQSSAGGFFELHLEPGADFVIRSITSGTTPKTLKIHYQKEAVLTSHQCGGTYKYTLKKITSNFSGKYKIINKELSILNDSDIDVQIYF
jgi:hypothetical protein